MTPLHNKVKKYVGAPKGQALHKWRNCNYFPDFLHEISIC